MNAFTLEALLSLREYLLAIANRHLSPRLRQKVAPSDVVQQSLLEAVRDEASFRGASRQKLKRWLRKILFHNLANIRRDYQDTAKRNLGCEISLSEAESTILGMPSKQRRSRTPSSILSDHEQQLRLRNAIEKLRPDQRRVLMLRNWQHLSFEAIGREMDRSAEAARKLWSRAVERLARMLAERP